MKLTKPWSNKDHLKICKCLMLKGILQQFSLCIFPLTLVEGLAISHLPQKNFMINNVVLISYVDSNIT